MEITKLGKIFIDGQFIDLDGANISELEGYKKKVIEKEDKVIDNINKILIEY